MNTDESNFKAWFVDALQPLRLNGHAGFIFALVSFPLLERYLREKSGAGEAISLPVQFFNELASLFPAISGKQSAFWHSYRNGLLHQVSFSKSKISNGGVVVMPQAGLSGYNPRPVYYDATTDSFYMNPLVFFDTVTAKILSDFSTYRGVSSPAHILPWVQVPGFGSPTIVPTIGAPFICGTGNYVSLPLQPPSSNSPL